MNEVRVKYSGGTPGADTDAYVVFDSTVAFPGANFMQGAGLTSFILNLDHSHGGTINAYASYDRGVTWYQTEALPVAAPVSSAYSSRFEHPISPFADFKVEWVNGGTAQNPWSVDIALDEETGSRVMYGIGSIDNDTSLTTAAPGGTAGDAAGFGIGMLVRPLSFAAQAWAARRVVGSLGWIHGQSTATLYRFACYDGASALVNSPTFDITAYANKVISIFGLHDGSLVRIFLNGVEVGAGTAITGYSPAPAAATSFGGAGSTTPQFDFFGTIGVLGVPTAGNILEWHNRCRIARRCVDMPGVPGEHMWPARQSLAAPLDVIGSDNLSLAGSGHTFIASRSTVWV